MRRSRWFELEWKSPGRSRSSGLSLALALCEDDVTLALHRLESEGQVLRGMFRPGSQELEWCDRRLLQRIHRLTVGRLRREIEPLTRRRTSCVSCSDGITSNRAMRSVDRADSSVRCRCSRAGRRPAAAWEQVLLPARCAGNVRRAARPSLLDRRRRLGSPEPPRAEVRWAPSRCGGGAGVRARALKPGRTANLTFVRRSELGVLLAAARADVRSGWPGGSGRVEPGRRRRARPTRRMLLLGAGIVARACSVEAVEDALWDLLGRGLVTADAVDNLRVLLSPEAPSPAAGAQARRTGAMVIATAESSVSEDERLAGMGRLLLSRWGIVFRDLVVREPLAPPWRELVRHYRRLEARGEIRGGRFLAGVGGEQFAVPDAVEVARTIRRSRPKRTSRWRWQVWTRSISPVS